MCRVEEQLDLAGIAYVVFDKILPNPIKAHVAGLIMVSEAYYAHFAKSGACDQRMTDMAKAMGCADAKSPLDFVAALVWLQKDCGVYALKMSDYGIIGSEMGKYAENARITMGGLFQCDPAPLSDQDVVAILEKSYR